MPVRYCPRPQPLVSATVFSYSWLIRRSRLTTDTGHSLRSPRGSRPFLFLSPEPPQMRTPRIRNTVQLREERNNGHPAVALRRTNSRGGPVPPCARSSRKRIRPSIGAGRHATQSMGVARRNSRQPATPHRLPGRPHRQPAPRHHARPGRPPNHVYCRVHLGLAPLACHPRRRW